MVEIEVKIELQPKNLQSEEKGCGREGPDKDLIGESWSVWGYG